jgi:hypothetical protein
MKSFDEYASLISEKGLKAVLEEENQRIASDREKSRMEKELIKKYIDEMEKNSTQNS